MGPGGHLVGDGPYGDEVGLGLVKSEALTYDWIYDLLDADERAKAEGISFGMAYNTIFITPLEWLRVATGFDVWQRSFYIRHQRL